VLEDKRTCECQRCKYQFEVSRFTFFIDKIFSFPFSSIIYSTAIAGLDYLIAYYTQQIVNTSFGAYYTFVLMASGIVIGLFYYTIIYRKSQDSFLISRKRNVIEKIVELAPLVKVSILLLVATLAATIYYGVTQ
jgi:hypothetical protein